jgi:PAS domain S-box-containing protein
MGRGERLWQFQTEQVKKSGEALRISLTASPVRDAAGTVTRSLILARELSPQPKVEEDPRRLAALLRDSNDAITVQDSAGRILAWNRGAERMYGYSEAEAVGMNHLEIVPDNLHDQIRSLAETVWRGETVPPFETKRVAMDGRILNVWLTITALRNETGKPYALVTTERDITERKRNEKRLQRANRELESFVHSVSHDLRTPLTAIIGFAEFVRDSHGNALDDSARKALSEIESQGARMAAMLEDLLVLARMGVWERPREPVDVNEVVLQVVSEQKRKITQVGVEVRRGSLPKVLIPETMLYQVFSNLIGNAVRYAGKMGGTIEVEGKRQGERVRFFVRDHGPGIRAEERQRIFELFQRGSTGQLMHGTGVGLSIVQKIARLSGGDAWVEDTPGGGSTFWVEFKEAPLTAGQGQ